MRKSVRLMLCLLASLFFIMTNALASSTIISANSFSQVKHLIETIHHPRHLLMALDDDDTLTMIPCPPYSVGTQSSAQCQYLGGPAWFAWQESLSKNNPERDYRQFSQLLAIQSLLFSMNQMPLDDPAIPAALYEIKKVGAHVIVATARGYSMSDNTENQLQHDGILTSIENRSLKTPGDHTSFPGFYFPTPWANDSHPRRIAYIHGILYLSGQNKGVMLQQFLEKMHQTKNIKTIIFVDDTMQNVKDVAKVYAKDSRIHAICIHYTRLAAHKAALTKGKDAKRLQAIANQQWKNIKTSLNHNLSGAITSTR